jgi:hypothetical protein
VPLVEVLVYSLQFLGQRIGRAKLLQLALRRSKFGPQSIELSLELRHILFGFQEGKLLGVRCVGQVSNLIFERSRGSLVELILNPRFARMFARVAPHLRFQTKP